MTANNETSPAINNRCTWGRQGLSASSLAVAYARSSRTPHLAPPLYRRSGSGLAVRKFWRPYCGKGWNWWRSDWPWGWPARQY